MARSYFLRYRNLYASPRFLKKMKTDTLYLNIFYLQTQQWLEKSGPVVFKCATYHSSCEYQ